MKYREYIEEDIKDASEELNDAFNSALKEVFTKQYLYRIKNFLRDYIFLRETEMEQNVVAYNVGSKIYINKNEFYNYPPKEQSKYILHEFIHVLQRKGGFLFYRFKDIRVLTLKIHEILKEHLTQPLSVFLTGKNQDLGSSGKWEVLSYFMNDSINWQAISSTGKNQILIELKSSGIFNTESQFWKKRLT